METFYLITHLIDSIFIKGLFISVLSIIIVGRVLKADTRNAFAIIKWIVFVYAALNIVYYYAVSFSGEMLSFNERAMGPYNLVYYLMMVPNTLLPLLLLFKKWGRNKYILLALSLLMNVGWMFELFTIYNTDFHIDHIHSLPSLNFLWFIALKGVFIGAVIYAIGRAVTRKRADIPVS
jgi:hypothetical protein